MLRGHLPYGEIANTLFPDAAAFIEQDQVRYDLRSSTNTGLWNGLVACPKGAQSYYSLHDA